MIFTVGVINLIEYIKHTYSKWLIKKHPNTYKHSTLIFCNKGFAADSLSDGKKLMRK